MALAALAWRYGSSAALALSRNARLAAASLRWRRHQRGSIGAQ